METTNPSLSDFNAKISQSLWSAVADASQPSFERKDVSPVIQIRSKTRSTVSITTLKYLISEIQARSSRSRYLPEDLFADPAWDILLHLTRSELEGRRVSTSKLCTAANVPPTTALRRIENLVARDVLKKRPDPLDQRRVFIELTQTAFDSMLLYLEDCSADETRKVA